MKSKKAQEGIIVTVLLVLVAIAAVSIVAYFVIQNIKGGTNTATDKADCIKVVQSFSLDKARATYTLPVGVSGTNYTELTISRQSETIALKAINMYVNGKLAGSTTTIPAQLETVSLILTNSSAFKISAGDEVRINPILNSTGNACENGAKIIAVA